MVLEYVRAEHDKELALVSPVPVAKKKAWQSQVLNIA
jgi:hypothetical protein